MILEVFGDRWDIFGEQLLPLVEVAVYSFRCNLSGDFVHFIKNGLAQPKRVGTVFDVENVPAVVPPAGDFQTSCAVTAAGFHALLGDLIRVWSIISPQYSMQEVPPLLAFNADMLSALRQRQAPREYQLYVLFWALWSFAQNDGQAQFAQRIFCLKVDLNFCRLYQLYLQGAEWSESIGETRRGKPFVCFLSDGKLQRIIVTLVNEIASMEGSDHYRLKAEGEHDCESWTGILRADCHFN
jgi:hypothetical protein